MKTLQLSALALALLVMTASVVLADGTPPIALPTGPSVTGTPPPPDPNGTPAPTSDKEASAATTLPQATDTVPGLIPAPNRLILPCRRTGGLAVNFPAGQYCIGHWSFFTLTCPGSIVKSCPSGNRCQEDPTVPASAKCVPNTPTSVDNSFPRLCQVFGDKPNTKYCVGKGNSAGVLSG